MDWVKIKKNHPKTFMEFMQTKFSLEDFWEAYSIYVDIRVKESNSGEEYWDFKIESKLVMYSSLCSKTIKRNGQILTIHSSNDIKMKIVNRVFKIIEEQIKDNNFLRN